MHRFPFIPKSFCRLADAVRWVSRVEEDARVKDSSEFRIWLKRGRNKEAHDRVRETWGFLDDQSSMPELLALRRETLERVRGAHAVRRPGRNLAWIGPAAVALLTGAIVVGILSKPDAPITYSTGIGERRAVVLEDHSKIWLDASTVVAVEHYSRDSRELSLIRGRARFDVAPDKARPFSVTSEAETTVAVGTSFNVERLSGKTIVTVRHGHVLVKEGDGPGGHAPIPLGPNQRLVAKRDGQVSIQAINRETRDAWQQGKIVFDDQYLGDAVEQFNRYLAKPILVDDAIGRIRIAGVFNAGDSRSFINAIANYFPVRARPLAHGQILLMANPEAKPEQSAPDR